MSPKVDDVVEAVRFTSNGKIDRVRVYHRRGPAYSDRMVYSRAQLIEKINKGKKIYTGRRIPYLAGTFEIGERIVIGGKKDNVTISIEGKVVDQDYLPEVNLF